MIRIATKVLEYTGPLLMAIERRKLEGKSQKEIAELIGKDEAWVSRRVQEATKNDLIEVRVEYRWGWHYTYGTYARWEVNTIWLKEKGREAVKTLLDLDPIIQPCPHCEGLIDIIGYSGLISCPHCGHVFPVEGIEPPQPPREVPWWAYLLSFFGGGAVGAILDDEDRWRGFAVGAGVTTTITAVVDGIINLA